MEATLSTATLSTVFVYGTLMPHERNAHVATAKLKNAYTAQAATLSGYQLLHLIPEGYPALVPGHPRDLVSGFALTYTPSSWHQALPYLDELEGIAEQPPLYHRQQVKVHLSTGEEKNAWVYLYARYERLKAPGAEVVPGGDWRTVPNRNRTEAP